MAKTAELNKSKKRRGPGPVAWTFMGVGAGALVGSVTAGVFGSLATLFAREVVTPATTPEENVEVLKVSETDTSMTITLQLSPDTTVPGVYSFWFDADRGHARLGDVVDRDTASVTREVLSVDRGDLTQARRGRMGGSVYLTPSDLGLEYQDVDVPVSAGKAPAWLIPGTTRADTWAIMIHGRGARRVETLRGVPTAHEAGMTTLCVSYRNDGEAPDVNNGRYGLGATEWRDID
ncbi:MAG: lipase, partial [Galactobacter sp.]